MLERSAHGRMFGRTILDVLASVLKMNALPGLMQQNQNLIFNPSLLGRRGAGTGSEPTCALCFCVVAPNLFCVVANLCCHKTAVNGAVNVVPCTTPCATALALLMSM